MNPKRKAMSRGAWLSGLAAGLFLLGSAAISLASASQALPEEPFARGKALLLQGKYAEARASFETALGQSPDNKEMRYYRGVSWLKLNNPDAAWADFQATLDADPGFALAMPAAQV
jgi:tetratricopeptide (TPR) repeat protein